MGVPSASASCSAISAMASLSPVSISIAVSTRTRAVLAPWANGIVSALRSYAEISPSDQGAEGLLLYRGPDDVRWFLDRIGVEGKDRWGCKRGVPGLSGANHGPGIEIYCSHHFFTVTGRLWSADHPHITSCYTVISSKNWRRWFRQRLTAGASRPGGGGGLGIVSGI